MKVYICIIEVNIYISTYHIRETNASIWCSIDTKILAFCEIIFADTW